MIKAIFFDIDGTLLSHSKKQVPLSTRKALEELKRKGIQVVAATGRHLLEMEELPVNDIEFDAYITLNGQLCLDANKNLLFAHPIEGKEKENIIQIFNEKKIPIMIVEKDRYYMNFVNEYVIQVQDEISTSIPPIGEYTGNDIYMLSVYLDEEQCQQVDFGNCRITRWNDLGIDVIASVGGKVVGIEKYLKYTNISREETMAFGDGENDIEMLEYVSIGVAMGNASDEVKAKADYVSDDIDDDGLYHALKKWNVL